MGRTVRPREPGRLLSGVHRCICRPTHWPAGTWPVQHHDSLWEMELMGERAPASRRGCHGSITHTAFKHQSPLVPECPTVSEGTPPGPSWSPDAAAQRPSAQPAAPGSASSAHPSGPGVRGAWPPSGPPAS